MSCAQYFVSFSRNDNTICNVGLIYYDIHDEYTIKFSHTKISADTFVICSNIKEKKKKLSLSML